ILIPFTGQPAKKAAPTLAVADNSLTGTTPTLAVAETTAGVDVTGRGAPKGALLIDTNAGALFHNTGTAGAAGAVHEQDRKAALPQRRQVGRGRGGAGRRVPAGWHRR